MKSWDIGLDWGFLWSSNGYIGLLVILALAFGFTFPAMMIFLVSRYGGWYTLARQYPLSGAFPHPGKRFGGGRGTRQLLKEPGTMPESYLFNHPSLSFS